MTTEPQLEGEQPGMYELTERPSEDFIVFIGLSRSGDGFAAQIWENEALPPPAWNDAVARRSGSRARRRLLPQEQEHLGGGDR